MVFGGRNRHICLDAVRRTRSAFEAEGEFEMDIVTVLELDFRDEKLQCASVERISWAKCGLATAASACNRP